MGAVRFHTHFCTNLYVDGIHREGLGHESLNLLRIVNPSSLFEGSLPRWESGIHGLGDGYQHGGRLDCQGPVRGFDGDSVWSDGTSRIEMWTGTKNHICLVHGRHPVCEVRCTRAHCVRHELAPPRQAKSWVPIDPRRIATCHCLHDFREIRHY